MILTYDGSFPGLLSCISRALGTSPAPSRIIDQTLCEPALFDEIQHIPTAAEDFDILRRRFLEQAGPESWRVVVNAFHHSEKERKDTAILHYVEGCLTKGREHDRATADPWVRIIHRFSSQVGKEAHRMKGFIRFQELDSGAFHAACAPLHDVVPLIAGHFRKRLNDRPWVIHDVSRSIAAIYDTEELRIEKTAAPTGISVAVNEANSQELWRQYFTTISIQARENPHLQQHHVPKRYQVFLTEFQ